MTTPTFPRSPSSPLFTATNSKLRILSISLVIDRISFMVNIFLYKIVILFKILNDMTLNILLNFSIFNLNLTMNQFHIEKIISQFIMSCNIWMTCQESTTYCMSTYCIRAGCYNLCPLIAIGMLWCKTIIMTYQKKKTTALLSGSNFLIPKFLLSLIVLINMEEKLLLSLICARRNSRNEECWPMLNL